CGVREQPLETVELAALVVGWDERTQGRLDVGDVLAADRYEAGTNERRVLRPDHVPAVAEWIDQELVRLAGGRGPDSRVRVEQPDEARELDELLILGRRGDRRADLGELCDPRRFRVDRERVGMERADFPVELIEILVPGVRGDGGSSARARASGGGQRSRGWCPRWRRGPCAPREDQGCADEHRQPAHRSSSRPVNARRDRSPRFHSKISTVLTAGDDTHPYSGHRRSFQSFTPPTNMTRPSVSFATLGHQALGGVIFLVSLVFRSLTPAQRRPESPPITSIRPSSSSV